MGRLPMMRPLHMGLECRRTVVEFPHARHGTEWALIPSVHHGFVSRQIRSLCKRLRADIAFVRMVHQLVILSPSRRVEFIAHLAFQMWDFSMRL